MLAVSHVIVTGLTVFSTSCSLGIAICIDIAVQQYKCLTPITCRIVLGVKAHCQHQLSKMRVAGQKTGPYSHDI